MLVAVIVVVAAAQAAQWRCPELSQPPAATCSCDLPHTVRCSGDHTALEIIASRLRRASGVSLLDLTVQDNMTSLDRPILQGVALHGLVVSSGELTHVSSSAFSRLRTPLQALGLPNNKLEVVPTRAIASIPTLDRLDLSHNRLKSLSAHSFTELMNLTFLDLSDNAMDQLEPGCFKSLPALRTLRLRGNRLGFLPVGVALLGLPAPLQELDLSGNSLLGPLGPSTLPPLPALLSIQLAHNQLSSVQNAALRGTQRLLYLCLRHNQIDVLEDYAFSEISSLERLDLSHNRIVAVSGASLEHLARLVHLDLSHNFLRTLATDLMLPLKQLQELHLDDNDISMIPAEVVAMLAHLVRLTLIDNPLNCDCGLARFAEWLANSSMVPSSDRATAVCTTPPSLENGLVLDVSQDDLVCGDDELPPPQGPLAPVFPVSSQVVLQAFQYDGATVSMVWKVSPNAVPYICDNLFVYEEVDAHEVLAESSPLQCNSSSLPDPHLLPVTLSAEGFLPGRRYRYCLVLLVGGDVSDEVALGLGCSDIVPLVLRSKLRAKPANDSPPPLLSIASLRANMTEPGKVLVEVQVWNHEPSSSPCFLAATVYVGEAAVTHSTFNCTVPSITLQGLPRAAVPYRVCVSIESQPPASRHASCVTAIQEASPTSGHLPGVNVVLFVCLAAGTSVLFILTWLGVRWLICRPKLVQTHQCFLAGPQSQQQHARYVKLHATTKL